MKRIKTILFVVCIVIWANLCMFNFLQKNKINGLQEQNSNTKRLCEELEDKFYTYEEENRNISEKLKEHEQCQEDIAAKLALYENTEQAFHGRWSVCTADEFYRQYLGIEDMDIKEQEAESDLPSLLFLDYHTQSISICGPRRIPITQEPRYRFRICQKEELFQALEHTEADIEKIDALLDKDYCVEMSYDDLEEWDRIIYPEEEQFINAKYYPLNFDIMLCVPQDGRGEVFFMVRFIDWILET